MPPDHPPAAKMMIRCVWRPSLIGHLSHRVYAQDSLDTFFQMLMCTKRDREKRNLGSNSKTINQYTSPSILSVMRARAAPPPPSPPFSPAEWVSLEHPFFQNPRCVIRHDTMEHDRTTGHIDSQICPCSLK
jgi:hypothetical protein